MSFAATLSITPALIVDCQNGFGVAQLNWTNATGTVQVRVNQPDGPQLTGFSDSSGSASTGPWVTDEMKFFLVDQSGTVEAAAVAHLSCGGTVRTIDPGLQTGSYFPLQLGNTWIYKSNDRATTASYVTRSIIGTEVIGGQTYFDLAEGSSIIARLRADSSGAIWMATPSGDRQYLDPAAASARSVSYSGVIGDFSDALETTALVNAFELDDSIFVRAIGLAHLNAVLEEGSSGGFWRSLDLVEVRMPDVRAFVAAASLSFSADTTDLDVSDHLVPNCALPCYFASCGLGVPAPDPPGAYRPCIESRIEAIVKPGSQVRLELLDSADAVRFSTAIPVDSTGRGLQYVRLPVYTPQSPSNAPQLLPSGQYRLVGQVTDSGNEAATASLNLRVH